MSLWDVSNLTLCFAPDTTLVWQLRLAVINSIPVTHSTLKRNVECDISFTYCHLTFKKCYYHRHIILYAYGYYSPGETLGA